MDEDGYFFYKGRVDQMFVCNGRNIFPLEIDTILLGHSHVRSVCAVPIRDREGRNIPAVLIEPSAPIREDDIVDYALQHGPSHGVPRFVRFVDRLPLIGPGKIDRCECTRVLQAAFDEGVTRRAAREGSLT
ncbi:MAG: hypothetical protein IRZ28_12855 [Steroidobacteraceae bacterium]|nr:hypothetical protein [Steroidobacteraceae bacterium]